MADGERPGEGFRELVDRVGVQPRALPGRRDAPGESGAYVVRWAETWYWARLFVDDLSFAVGG